MAAIQKTGPYTDEIIPPELWPTAHEAAASAATSFCDARQESESAADAYRRGGSTAVGNQVRVQRAKR